MNIPSSPLASGTTVRGQGSWFGGPHDSTDSGHTASGGTTREPGIAVYNRATLGGYWRVRAPNGRTVVVRQTDLGPAPFTNRKIDVTYSALGKFGYNEGNFPTSAGEFTATYLGKNQPKGGAVVEAPPQAVPKAPAAQAAPAAVPGAPVFDQAGFDKAQKASILGRLLSEGGERKDNPLFSTGLVTTKAPLRSEFTTAGAPAVPKLPGAPQAAAQPSAATSRGGRGKLGGFLPGNAELQWNRIDQGQDVKTNPGGPIVAPGDGMVVAVKSDPGGFGPDYPIVKFTSGPLAGTSWYLGHTHTALKAGEAFHAGQTLSHTGTHGVGNATVPGWAEIGLSSALGSGNMSAGKATERYLKRR